MHPLPKSLLRDQGGSARLIDGKAFYIEAPSDIQPTLREGSNDPRRWTRWRKTNYEFYRDELAKIPDVAALLDFGVGQAQFRDLYARLTTVATADFFPYPEANVVCDLTKSLPFVDNVFDVIVASNVFEHLPNTTDVLAECRRVLKPDGTLLATIPFLLRVHQEPYDFHRYTNLMLEKLLIEGGFATVAVRELGTPEDCYLQTQLHFFNYLLEKPTFKTKMLWKLQGALNRLGASSFGRVTPRPEYTLGYSLIGKKI